MACDGDYTLILETSSPFYPLLQELTYIRPLRFASPSAFAEGLDSDPDLHNSCETGKSASALFYLVNACVHYEVSVIWPLCLNLV